MSSISQAKPWHLTSIAYRALKTSYHLCPAKKTILLQLKILTSLTSFFNHKFSQDSPTCWCHSLILAHIRKTDYCFQASITWISTQLANKVSPHAYLFIFVHDKASGLVFWLLTCHNTHIDKIITQAILTAQFYIHVIPSFGEDVWTLPSLFD